MKHRRLFQWLTADSVQLRSDDLRQRAVRFMENNNFQISFRSDNGDARLLSVFGFHLASSRAVTCLP